MRISDSRNSALRIMPNNASNAAKGWEKPRGACSPIAQRGKGDYPEVYGVAELELNVL
jgi:hypothetical protein